MNLIKEIKNFFKTNDTLIILITINVAVFLLYHIVHIFLLLFKVTDQFNLYDYLAAPANLKRPWTLITYMFFHEDLLHLLFNMLWLYWFGKIFRMYFTGQTLVNVYILGGLFGVFFYIISYNIFPLFSEARHAATLCGASAGVLAVVLAISCYVPKFSVNLLFLGRVKLIYIALVTIALDIVALSMSKNAGGHIAHLGGAFFGYLFAVNYLKGKDITAWFGKLCTRIGSLFKRKPKMRVAYKRSPTDDMEYNRLKNTNQKEIDRILDKISKGGYDTLSRKEKETLFSQQE